MWLLLPREVLAFTSYPSLPISFIHGGSVSYSANCPLRQIYAKLLRYCCCLASWDICSHTMALERVLDGMVPKQRTPELALA